MSLNAATIEVLIAKGLSADDLLEVARATEIKADRTNAERQARHRARRRNAVTVTDAPPKEETSNPETPKEPSGSSGVGHAKSNPFPKPDWADQQAWSDFLANRRKRKMTNSVTAYQQFLGDVARLSDDEWPPGRLLALAAGRGWGSINRLDDGHGRSGTNGVGRHQPDDGLGPNARAANAAFGPVERPGYRAASG